MARESFRSAQCLHGSYKAADLLIRFAAQHRFHDIDKAKTGTRCFSLQIGHAVPESIRRCLLPPFATLGLDCEDIKSAGREAVRDTGEGWREIAKIDHGVGGKN